jgi:hypothetical protein
MLLYRARNLRLTCIHCFPAEENGKENIGRSGIPEYRSERENAQCQRNTMLSYRSGQTGPVLPYGQGPMQDCREMNVKNEERRVLM